MPEIEPPGAGSSKDEVAAAVRQLHEAQRRLAELTGGHVDAVVHPDGQSYLLHDAQEKLREAEAGQRILAETQRSILNALPAHIALFDQNGSILAVNESWRRYGSENMHQGVEASVGKNYLEICEQAQGDGSEEARAAAAGIRQVLRGEKSEFSLEYPCDSPTEKHWFQLIVAPLGNGTAEGAVAMHINITERKLAEEARRDSEEHQRRLTLELEAERERLVAAQEVARVGSSEMDLNTFAIIWSLECHRIFETTPGEFELTYPRFMEIVHPEDRERLDAEFMGSFKKDAVSLFEHRLLMPDKRIKFVEERWRIVRDEQGKPARAIGTCQDITERKEAERVLRDKESLIRLAGRLTRTGGWSMKRSDGLVHWSDELCEIMEVPPGRAMALNADLRAHPESMRKKIKHFIDVCVFDGTPFEVEVEISTAKGRKMWGHVCGEPQRDASGAIDGVWGAFQDITERKEAERVLRLNEEGFRLVSEELAKVLNSSLDVICAIDEEGRFTTVSAACETMWGYKPEELIGKPYMDLVLPDDRPATRDSAADVVAGNATKAFENRYVRKDGTVARVMWSAWWSETDRSIFGVARDITERHKQEEQLRLLEVCISRLNDAIIICAVDQFDENKGAPIIFVNEAFERITGFTRAEAIGKTPPALLHGPKTDQEVVKLIHQALKNGESIRAEIIHYTKAGAQYWNEISVVPILSATGRITHIVSVERDNTAALQARERIAEQAALIDQARDAILVRNLDREITFWNKGAEQIYGWSAGEAVGARTDELFRFDSEKLVQIEQELLEKGEWKGELQKVTKANVKVVLDCRWTLLRDNDGRPKGFLQIETDVSERKQIEQQFLRAQRMESIGTLAGGIAHDLNNVLGPILMSIEILKTTCPDPESQNLLELISMSAQRGADMVSQVLSFARGVEGDRMELQVKHLIADIVKIANDTFLKHIEIINVYPRELSPILGDPTQLHQVLLNLCVNARDAMPNGGRLTISAEDIKLDEHYAAMDAEAKAGNYVLLQVEDTGSGIPAGIIEKIFDPFFTTKDVGKGTGLGLSTTMAIVRSHGGFLRVYSEVGKGTKFKIYLPASSDPSPETAEAAEAKIPRGNGELLLVVDDESTVRQVTQQTLNAFGYRTLIASDGPEAVVIFARHCDEIAVVLTDMMMPGMDGYSTIQALKRIKPSVRIIAASGLALNEHVARAASLGVMHFLPKPYTAEKLLTTLKQVIEGK